MPFKGQRLLFNSLFELFHLSLFLLEFFIRFFKCLIPTKDIWHLRILISISWSYLFKILLIFPHRIDFLIIFLLFLFRIFDLLSQFYASQIIYFQSILLFFWILTVLDDTFHLLSYASNHFLVETDKNWSNESESLDLFFWYLTKSL